MFEIEDVKTTVVLSEPVLRELAKREDTAGPDVDRASPEFLAYVADLEVVEELWSLPDELPRTTRVLAEPPGHVYE